MVTEKSRCEDSFTAKQVLHLLGALPHENSEGHSPTYAPARLKICNVPSLNISVLAQSKVGTYFRLHLGNRCSGTDGSEVPSKRMKGNPSHSPFFPICEGALKAFNAVGDIYANL